VPGLVIIDAHRHLWDPVRFRYPWLSAGPEGAEGAELAAPYLAADFAADTAGVDVAGSVLMEGGRDDALAEARWLSELAGPRDAVVARVTLEDADVEDQLDTLRRCPPVRGVRQLLNVAGRDTPRPVYAAARAGLMADPAWRRGLSLVAAAGLTFDVQAQPHQLTEVSVLAADFGGLTFVLDHGGYMTPRTDQAQQDWRAGIRAAARQPNVAVKVSDYSTVDPSLRGLTGFVRELTDVFGPDRTLFASNFPGERRAVSYQRLVDAFGGGLAGLDPAEQAAVWAGSATRIYRLGPPARLPYVGPGPADSDPI
jgi:predicted TIM-barrel fold metal-dependent hydrolase